MKHGWYGKCRESNHTPDGVQYVFQETYRKGENGCMQLGKDRSNTGYAMASCL